MLVCIDGSGSAGWSDREHARSHCFRVYRRYSVFAGRSLYFHGPGSLGLDTPAIVNDVWKELQGSAAGLSRRQRGGEPLDLFGFSRGAASAIEIAWRLCESGLGVRFLGLFDAVSLFFPSFRPA